MIDGMFANQTVMNSKNLKLSLKRNSNVQFI
jgi:hypothetical protein